MFQHVVIVGCGLIGSSFGLALRRAGFDGSITGWGQGDDSLAVALGAGAIDEVERSFVDNAPCQADLFYLATPIGAIVDFLRRQPSLVRPGTLVTDAGSTKVEICRAARLFLPPNVDFIGGHPMAGSEKAGASHARADLFDGATYILTPDERIPAERIASLELLVREIGAHPVRMKPDEHDRTVSLISHLPQFLSSALAAMMQEQPDAEKLFRLSAGSYRDVARLAASPFTLWRDISLTNRENIRRALDLFIEHLRNVRDAMETGDFNLIKDTFQMANQAAENYHRAKQSQDAE